MVGRDACAMVKGELSKIRAIGSVNDFLGETHCSLESVYKMLNDFHIYIYNYIKYVC